MCGNYIRTTVDLRRKAEIFGFILVQNLHPTNYIETNSLLVANRQ
jgi:hypothetical protein